MVQDCYTGGRGSEVVARRLVERGIHPSFSFEDKAGARTFRDCLYGCLTGEVEELPDHVLQRPYIVTVSRKSRGDENA